MPSRCLCPNLVRSREDFAIRSRVVVNGRFQSWGEQAAGFQGRPLPSGRCLRWLRGTAKKVIEALKEVFIITVPECPDGSPRRRPIDGGLSRAFQAHLKSVLWWSGSCEMALDVCW